MSSLHHLEIMGIRSFGTEQAQVVKFETPLTLIVGQNGSGKTTIIECLKFAFTGAQPPNTKVGGAFVHDPKLDNDKVVKALVRVGFKSTKRTALIIARRLELTVKKNTRSLKTLESSLKQKQGGENIVVSSRVADLDDIVPRYLGVSSAIIDNVIFCHQDESLWPLSDASTLKKKFDEIFEAQKYTKAIDNIKQIRKNHYQVLGGYKKDEEEARKAKDNAIKAQKQMVLLQDQVESNRAKVEELERQMSTARRLADEAWRKGEEYAKVLGMLEGKRIEAQGRQSTVDDLLRHLQEVDESDDWLQKSLDQFEARQQELKEAMSTKQGEYLAVQDSIKGLGADREDKVKLKGKYEQEKDEHDRQLGRRREMVKDVAAKHQIRRVGDLDDEVQVQDFMVAMRKILRSHQEALEQAKVEHATARREAQTLVNRLTERRTALQDSKGLIRKQMDANDREAETFQRRVDQIQVDEGSKAVAESRLDDLTAKLHKARAAAEQAAWETKAQSAGADQLALEDLSSKLNDEIVASTKKAGELAKVTHLKQELKERQRSLETLLNAHGERLGKVLGAEWGPASVETIYQEQLTDRSDQSVAAERQRDELARELDQVQFQQKALRSDLASKKAEAEKCEKQIRAVTERGPDRFDEALQHAEAEVAEIRDQVTGFTGMVDYFTKALNTANSDVPTCRMCLRQYKSSTDPVLGGFRKRLENMIAQASQSLSSHDADLQGREAHYKRVLDMGMRRDTWRKLVDTDIPAVAEQLTVLEGQQDRCIAKLERQDKAVEQRQQAKRDVESVGRTVASIAKYDLEIKTFTAQVDDLAAKQSQQHGGRPLDEIRDELNSVSLRIREAQNVISRLRAEQERSRADISGMEIELRDLKGELGTIEFQLDKKASLVARVEEFRAQNQKQRDSLDDVDRDVTQLDPDISTAKVKYEDVDLRATTQERGMSHELSRLNESVNALELLNDQVRSYLDRDGPHQLGHVNSDLTHLEQRLEQEQKAMAQLTRDMNKINEQIRDADVTKRRYSDNLRYRQESRALAQLREEIQELESKNAAEDRDNFQRASQQHTREYNRLNTQQAGLIGEMKSTDSTLQRLLQDFDLDLKDAPQRYKEAHIKVEATKAAVEDLGRYGGALDKAIMEFHSLKMGEINGIIEELWRKTYKGTDVDSIMIRADNADSGRGNRSYNYRLVMVKQGAEMDMRGRCSAGQKVLASIIIRLALAECFSANCGLIALDEPTTNLDRENIESLAHALKDIINYRKQQANFQLVIITHDEEFLREMDCAEFANYYYRVSRNHKQDSIIERQKITDVL